jgi:hypothetical protein
VTYCAWRSKQTPPRCAPPDRGRWAVAAGLGEQDLPGGGRPPRRRLRGAVSVRSRRTARRTASWACSATCASSPAAYGERRATTPREGSAFGAERGGRRAPPAPVRTTATNAPASGACASEPRPEAPKDGG